jgi:selenocysteine lyase/cysteine desulfurase
MRLPGTLASLTDKTWRPAQQSLYSDYGIECPLMTWNNQPFIRISAQVYNQPDEYIRLAAAIEAMSQRQW